jgi:hypothetical protein
MKELRKFPSIPQRRRDMGKQDNKKISVLRNKLSGSRCGSAVKW